MHDDELYRRDLEHPDIVRMMRDGLLDRPAFADDSEEENGWDYTFEDAFL